MNALLDLLLLAVGIISIIPVIQLTKIHDDLKYKYLKYLINTTFVWTILIFIERLSSNAYIIYYAHMIEYPVKFLMAIFVFHTICQYVDRKVKKWEQGIFLLVLLLEIVGVFSNISTKYVKNLSPDMITSYKDVYIASEGFLYILYFVAVYTLLFISIILLFYFMSKNKHIRQYKLVSNTMILSIGIVLVVKSIDIMLMNLTVDLTYMSLVIVVYLLYRAIYSKDMVFNLKSSGRGEILNNMREMYILTDHEYNIVDISKLLTNQYNIDSSLFIGRKLKVLINKLENDIVFYKEYNVDEDKHENKAHFHLREKKFSLKGLKEYGYMILLYDESKVFNLLRELNKQSNYDNMTELHNRNFMEHKLPEYDRKKNLGVLSLDLNGLKANNDYIGHERGDFLLKSLANNMKTVMKLYENYTTARIGGDEFLIIVENTTLKEINIIKKEIIKLCDNEEVIDRISVAIGISFDEDGAFSIYQLVQLADKSMYEMKRGISKQYSKELIEYTQSTEKYIR